MAINRQRPSGKDYARQVAKPAKLAKLFGSRKVCLSVKVC